MDCEQIEVKNKTGCHVIVHMQLDLNLELYLFLCFFLRQKAVGLMSQVPKLCNDMMNLGRLQGYEVSSLPGNSTTVYSCQWFLKPEH